MKTIKDVKKVVEGGADKQVDNRRDVGQLLCF